MPRVKISEIKVGPRVRKDYGDLEKLSLSIQRYGLLHPICITRDKQLVAGERRLKACQMLGMEEIEVKYLEDLDELERKEIEIEENIARKNFTWIEEVNSKLELDQLKRLKYGSRVKGHKTNGWGIQDTALALDQSVGSVSMDIALAEGLRIYPELKKEKTKTAAFKKLKLLRKRDLKRELARRQVIKPTPFVHLGDCVKVMRDKIKDDSVDLIVTDPQFGINLSPQTTMKSFTAVYKQDDTPERVFDQLDLALVEMHRVLKEGHHLYIFFAIQHYTTVRLLLERRFNVSPTPIIWYKEHQSNPGNLKSYTSSYEACFFCSKGRPRDLYKWNRNVIVARGVPGSKRIHPTEKPLTLLRVFIEASSQPGEVVLDPYAGSGSTLEAALQLKRNAIGIDIDERYVDAMNERLSKYVKGGDSA